ncbi:macrophage mannose receptor 1-like isoform X3 [Simochromis diagramma]|uniref:macrophage mannose receptor 1-like isoform X3 n=1 Tax=Simochromis diagramma TaxID=43689 RepID=UPI001A7EA963|nr:macrophage mannose receptor 1-like isoform X3 [Simochromis diagramma]
MTCNKSVYCLGAAALCVRARETQVHEQSTDEKINCQTQRMEETCLLLILLLSGGLSTLPPHSRKYHFVNMLMPRTNAESYCREHFTGLVTIYNSNINQLLVSMSPRINDYAWIGLYDDRYSWKWSMEGNLLNVGSKHEFLIWAKNQPNSSKANEYCVALQGQTQMDDRPCGDSYPFLCYNAKNTSYILVMENQTWSAAQSYCRTYHTDLTSIRSKEEKSKITLTLSGSGGQFVWIGLYRDPWAFWSDNTTSTFTNWTPSEPNNQYSNQYCAVMNLRDGTWSDTMCFDIAYVFCFTAVTKQTVLKMKLQSEADMHSTEIQQQVSQQLSGLMLSKGLTDFRIRWRKVQSYRDDQSKKQDVDGDCKTED